METLRDDPVLTSQQSSDLQSPTAGDSAQPPIKAPIPNGLQGPCRVTPSPFLPLCWLRAAAWRWWHAWNVQDKVGQPGRATEYLMALPALTFYRIELPAPLNTNKAVLRVPRCTFTIHSEGQRAGGLQAAG